MRLGRREGSGSARRALTTVIHADICWKPLKTVVGHKQKRGGQGRREDVDKGRNERGWRALANVESLANFGDCYGVPACRERFSRWH